MTTINNLTIEQMREIVDGAPDWAVSVNLHNGMYYELREYRRGHTFLSELRTAIAEYSPDSPDSYGWVGVHYNLGDHIVYKKPWVGHNLVLKIGGDGNQSMSLASASLSQNYIRHATPEEIKAGHRLEAERHG